MTLARLNILYFLLFSLNIGLYLDLVLGLNLVPLLFRLYACLYPFLLSSFISKEEVN
jgi:hypothetical protein